MLARDYRTPLLLAVVASLLACGCTEKPAGKVKPGSQTKTTKTAVPPEKAVAEPKAEATTKDKTTEDKTAKPEKKDDESPVTAKPEAEQPTTEEPAEEKPADEKAAELKAVEDKQENLTSGIPGEGPLTVEEIQAWVDDPKNHETIDFKLPLGLAAAQTAVKGLEQNPLTRAKIELGRQLYFDTRLSSDNTVSCASCHHPDEGYARGTRFGVGVDGQEGGRNSPVSFNRILSDKQFWDGRTASLEEQAVGPIANPIEMGNTHEQAVATVKGIKGYEIQFQKIFGDEGVTIDNIGKALASFERVIVTGPSPYDYAENYKRFADLDEEDLAEIKTDEPDFYAEYLQAKADVEAHPMSESAKRGWEIFFNPKKGDCAACHAGANFTDEQYHNLGVGMDADGPDLGRHTISKVDKEQGAFKTPTIRNIEFTAPYMHDGSQKTLEEVVEWYAKGGHPNPYLSDKIKKLDLTDQDKKDLVAFMKALSGDFPKVQQKRLPAN